MQSKRNISSYLLLYIYLLVVILQIVSTSNTLGLDGTPIPKGSHQHEAFEGIHHKHHFHIGIFHILGHLLEKINHASDLANDYLIFASSDSKKHIVTYKKSFQQYLDWNNLILIEVDAESLPDPPYYCLPYLQQLKHSNTLLRAPPLPV